MIHTIDNSNKISNDKYIDIYINNLNTIQKIISRISKIGYTLLGSLITITSIFAPIILSKNISLLMSYSLFILMILINIVLFISYFCNLRNERVWINIYNKKIKINIQEFINDNRINKLWNFDFNSEKKKEKVFTFKLFKSFPLYIWITISLFSIIVPSLSFSNSINSL